jgi:hypothetical protein
MTLSLDIDIRKRIVIYGPSITARFKWQIV